MRGGNDWRGEMIGKGVERGLRGDVVIEEIQIHFSRT